MYNGALDGQWNADLNQGLNRYLWEQQTAGKDAGTYSLNVDQIYGRETKKSMAAAMTAGNPMAPSAAMFRALNNMQDSGALRSVYRKEDLHIDTSPVTVRATPDRIQPVSTPVATQLTTPSVETGGPPEQFAQPAPAGVSPAGGRGPGQQQVRLPPGAVDLTGLVRSNRYGADNPVTLYDWQGNRATVALGPEALSGVVQVSRDPRIPNNIMLTVSDRAGQNATSYSMSVSDANRSLAGYPPATPLCQQIQAINSEIVHDRLNADRRARYHVPSEYVQPTPAPNWDGRFANVPYRDRLPPEPIRDFPNAPQMGAAFALEARGAGPYAMMMAQRQAIMTNAGGYDPRDRGVSVNIGVRIGQ